MEYLLVREENGNQIYRKHKLPNFCEKQNANTKGFIHIFANLMTLLIKHHKFYQKIYKIII